MLFNSIYFLFYFTATYILYWSIPESYRKNYLLIAGIVFYSFFSIGLTFHFILVVFINYIFYRKIATSPQKKFFLIIAITLNVINLGFFKYFYFINRVLFDVTSYPVFQEIPSAIHIALPMAISFYTFQIIAAAVDTYRSPPEPKDIIPIRDYFLFIIFFPVLIAGPIMRMREFFPNLQSLQPNKEKMYRASYLMISGLIKKILIADPASQIITPIFNEPEIYSSMYLFLAGIGYSIQVYCDFSGLTDMARSIALYLGFEIPENFKAPFFSTSGRELWRRWHITLSFWLRDYLYIPLGGSRVSEWRGYFNLIVTMTIGGFWHGADYTFVIWGFYWGVILALERMLEDKYKIPLTPERSTILKIFKAVIVFILFSISGLIFRANNAESMAQIFKGILFNSKDSITKLLFSNENSSWIVSVSELFLSPDIFYYEKMKDLEQLIYLLAGMVFFHWIQYNPEKFQSLRKWDSYLVFILGVVTILLLAVMSQSGGEFIYYRF